MKKYIITIIALLATTVIFATVLTTIDDFFLPGSQIGQSGNIETPDKCDNCHGGYNQAVEPAFNWRGSMMSQAARDPLFYACLAVANQDVPGVGDLCLRCHAPDGWLNGRCVPTDGSALNNNDRQGVQCDFCHKMVKPTPLGVNPYPTNLGYTSTAFGTGSYNRDQTYLGLIIPIPGTSANGMYIADASNAKRGPFTDATGRHQMFYSPFHSESEHCGTCHDVSNPAFTRLGTDDEEYTFNTPGVQSPTFDLRLMFPVERTYSEWKASGYNAPGTSAHKTCQDCHMKDVTGKGAKMNDAPVRTNLPLHDMTGGNTFTPLMVKQAYASEVSAAALDAGILRARAMLQSAADIVLTVSNNIASVKVINKTGHKLPTGYPEGRRIWINLTAYNAQGQKIFESGAYDNSSAILTQDPYLKMYHCEPGNDLGPSFHFALNNKIWYDNRIPPAGFTNNKLIEYQSPVISSTTSYADGQNWDITTYPLPVGTTNVKAKLYYQTTTKEYVEFLRDANTTNTKGQELYNLWIANGKSTPELMNSAEWGSPLVQSVNATINSITRITSSGNNINARASVLVTVNGNPISGATVTAIYTGPTSGTVTGTTGTNGIVLLNTSKKKSPTGTWCFSITNVIYPNTVFTPSTTPVCEMNLLSYHLDIVSEVAESFVKVFPNPFIESAFFELFAKEDANARVEIFRADGSKLMTLLDCEIKGGETKTTEYNPALSVAGMYIYRITIGDKIFTGKLFYTGH